jgi:amino acid transporter
MLIMLIPVYFQFEKVKIPNIEEEDFPVNKTSWLMILFFSLLIIGFRIIFGRGIQLGTESENLLGVTIVIVLASLMIIGIIIIGIRTIRQKRKKVYEMILKSLPDDADLEE